MFLVQSGAECHLLHTIAPESLWSILKTLSVLGARGFEVVQLFSYADYVGHIIYMFPMLFFYSEGDRQLVLTFIASSRRRLADIERLLALDEFKLDIEQWRMFSILRQLLRGQMSSCTDE